MQRFVVFLSNINRLNLSYRYKQVKLTLVNQRYKEGDESAVEEEKPTCWYQTGWPQWRAECWHDANIWTRYHIFVEEVKPTSLFQTGWQQWRADSWHDANTRTRYHIFVDKEEKTYLLVLNWLATMKSGVLTWSQYLDQIPHLWASSLEFTTN